MIKQKDLRSSGMSGYRFFNQDGWTMERASKALVGMLERKNERYGLPISFSVDEVKNGGIFTANNPCILITNKEHPGDYYKCCLILKAQGNIILLQIMFYGNSKLAAQAASGKMRGLGGVIRDAAFDTKDRWQQERDYYNALDALIAEALR